MRETAVRAVLLSSWTLFFGIFLFMAGNGLQGALLGTRAEELSFGDLTTGFIMAGYFAGFLLGSHWIPTLVSNVGHVRVFGALACLASTSILVHSVFEFANVWMLMRFATGFAYSGMYIVAESWINDKATNQTRGGFLSLYMITNMSGLIMGLMLLPLGDPATADLFILVAILVSIAVVPILMTAAKMPEFQELETVSIKRVYKTSPLAVIGTAMVGMSSASIFGMSSVYASKLGLTLTEISFFVAALMFGALILQFPIGKLSDIFDRRTIILIVEIMTVVAAVLAFFAEDTGFWLFLGAAVLFGGIHTPLYSLYIAHANDYLTPQQIVATSSKLVMISGFGAVLGAPLVGYTMGLYGPSAFYPTQGAIHATMTLIVIYRMFTRSATPTEAQAPFVAVPTRSSPIATTLHPEATWENKDSNNKDEKIPAA
jgi:MFS family permease